MIILQNYYKIIIHNSIIRKTCDGIEHIIIECLQCNKIFQQFATFRILDLAVVSQQIKLNNIIIVCNDKKYCIPQISVLDYCSVDILKYYAINYLVQEQNQEIPNDYDANVVIISSNGKIHNIHDNISNLQNLDGVIFVLINKNKTSKNQTGCILQVDLVVNKNNETELLSVSYNKYNPNYIRKLAQAQIKLRHNDNDEEKYDYYINYNGNVFDFKELEAKKIKPNA